MPHTTWSTMATWWSTCGSKGSCHPPATLIRSNEMSVAIRQVRMMNRILNTQPPDGDAWLTLLASAGASESQARRRVPGVDCLPEGKQHFRRQRPHRNAAREQISQRKTRTLEC